MTRAHSEFWRDPALPWIESRRACHSRACYKAHSLGRKTVYGCCSGAVLILLALGVLAHLVWF